MGTMNPLRTVSVPGSEQREISVRAKACCGPAHGQSWDVDVNHPIPERVNLHTAGQRHCYRLVRDLRALRPARDHDGNYLYMPEASAPTPRAPGSSYPPQACGR